MTTNNTIPIAEEATKRSGSSHMQDTDTDVKTSIQPKINKAQKPSTVKEDIEKNKLHDRTEAADSHPIAEEATKRSGSSHMQDTDTDVKTSIQPKINKAQKPSTVKEDIEKNKLHDRTEAADPHERSETNSDPLQTAKKIISFVFLLLPFIGLAAGFLLYFANR